MFLDRKGHKQTVCMLFLQLQKFNHHAVFVAYMSIELRALFKDFQIKWRIFRFASNFGTEIFWQEHEK